MIKKYFSTLKQHFDKWDNYALLLWSFFVSACNALYTGPDQFWDNLNYHIYNAYAALNNRIEMDIIPNGIHAFYNPNADLWYYALVRGLNSYPHLVVLLQSIWFFLCLFFTLKILQSALPKRSFNFLSVLSTSLLFLYAPAIFAWGSMNTGDMFSCSFLIFSLYALFTALQNDTKPHLAWLLVAGASYGISFSLKYTASPFLLAYIVMFCFCFRSFWQWLKSGLWFTVAAVGTFLVTSGWWLYKMYIHFQNPFFPFLNSVFQSPYFAPVDLVDKRFFVGKALWETLFIPFSLLRPYKMNIIEGETRTYLYFAYIFAILILGIYYYQHRHRKTIQTAFTKIWRPLMVFTLTGMVFWIAQFSLVRYAMPLEAVGSILITITLFLCIRGQRKMLLIGFLVGIMSFSQITYKEIRGTAKHLFAMSYTQEGPIDSATPFISGAPDIEDDAVVVLQGWRLSFIIPFLNPKAHYVGGLQPNIEDYDFPEERLDLLGYFSFSPVFFEHKFAPLIHQKIQQASSVYVLMFTYTPELYKEQPIKHYGVQVDPEKCTKIKNNWEGMMLLCKAKKI